MPGLDPAVYSEQAFPPAIFHILERYNIPGLRPQSVSFLGGAGGFSGAWIWRIESPLKTLCLRAWPPGGLSWNRLRGLHRLLALIRDAGLPQVSVPFTAADGSTLIDFAGRYWQLEPWMPGSADFAARPSPTRLRNAMVCLAGWHRLAASFVPRESEQDWFYSAASESSPGLLERFGQIESWNPSRRVRVRQGLDHLDWDEFQIVARRILDLFPVTASRIAAELREGLKVQIPLQPCLRDIWHDHILFSGDEVTGLIDPGACRTESVAADLARWLGSVLGDDRNSWNMALAEYEQIRRLSPGELMLIQVFDRGTVLLAGMTWLDWTVLQKRPIADRERVIVRLRNILDRLERLVP